MRVNVEGRLGGVLTALSTSERLLPADAEARLGVFTKLVAAAVANAQPAQSSATMPKSRRRCGGGDDTGHPGSATRGGLPAAAPETGQWCATTTPF
jgi:hypothetical protein